MDDPHLYLIRVWRAGEFRASVRVVGEDSTRVFHDAGSLGAFLGGCAGPGGPVEPDPLSRAEAPSTSSNPRRSA